MGEVLQRVSGGAKGFLRTFPRLRGKCQVVARSDTPDDGGSHVS
jgi:hypothetical protein